MKKILFLPLLTAATMINAADWKSLGNGFYVDASDIKKNGDLTQVTFKAPNINSEVMFYFDCKRKIIIEPSNNKEYTFQELKQLAQAESIVCKPSLFNFLK